MRTNVEFRIAKDGTLLGTAKLFSLPRISEHVVLHGKYRFLVTDVIWDLVEGDDNLIVTIVCDASLVEA